MTGKEGAEKVPELTIGERSPGLQPHPVDVVEGAAPPMVRLIIRGYLGRTVVFESDNELSADVLDRLLPSLAEEHANEMADGRLTMIEIEFPDDPEEQRFFRIGVDPSGMVMPIEVR